MHIDKCKKAELHCGPSCQCLNCMSNQQYASQQPDSQQEEVIEELVEAREKDNEDESEDSNDIIETMNEVFSGFFYYFFWLDITPVLVLHVLALNLYTHAQSLDILCLHICITLN